MTLTLDNFDQQLPKDLLKKAQPYVGKSAVLYVDQGEDGIWKAEVGIDVGKYYAELVKKIIRAHSDRHGSVEYRATFKLAKEMDSLLYWQRG